MSTTEMCVICGERPRHRAGSQTCKPCIPEHITRGNAVRQARKRTCEAENARWRDDADNEQQLARHAKKDGIPRGEAKLVARIRKVDRAIANADNRFTTDQLHRLRRQLCALLDESVEIRRRDLGEPPTDEDGRWKRRRPMCAVCGRVWCREPADDRQVERRCVCLGPIVGDFGDVPVRRHVAELPIHAPAKAEVQGCFAANTPGPLGRRKRTPWGPSTLRARAYSKKITRRTITPQDDRKTPQHGWCGGEPWLRQVVDDAPMGSYKPSVKPGDLTGQLLAPDPVQARLKRDAARRARGGDVVQLVQPDEPRMTVAA